VSKDLGINLIFSGWGGDEFISLGDRGIDMDLLFGIKWKSFFRRNPLLPLKTFIKYLLFYVIYPSIGKLDPGTAKSFQNDSKYIKAGFKKSDPISLKNFYFYSSRRKLHLGLLKFYHIQERTETWAINGFKHGVEYRYPLLDKRIIEYILKIPSALLSKSKHFRPLLREVSGDNLPKEIKWHWDKTDPVQMTQEYHFVQQSAIQCMDEINDWKLNPGLHFIDFALLEQDIVRFKETKPTDDPVLFRALVYIMTSSS